MCENWKFREFRHSPFVPPYSGFTPDLEGNRGSERLRGFPDRLECPYDHFLSFKVIGNHQEQSGNDTEATGARFRLEFLGFPQTHHLGPGASVNNSVTHCRRLRTSFRGGIDPQSRYNIPYRNQIWCDFSRTRLCSDSLWLSTSAKSKI